MNRLTDFLWCVVFAFAAVIITIKLNGPETVRAAEVPSPLPELTMPKFINPAGHLDLQIDLDKGTTKIESTGDIATVNTVVNHPAPKVKTIVKKEVVYETKTEYVEKLVMFKMPVPRVHVPHIELPTRVSK